MSHAVSIHIGVNAPGSASSQDLRVQLADSETDAWRMAELAGQAGFDSILVLRGAAATLTAVRAALLNAAQLLQKGDMLLVSFSGHGGQIVDYDGDDGSMYDESWSLHDGELLDDELLLSWRLFRPGVRIVVVSESCYSGGIYRGSNHPSLPDLSRRRRRRAYRGEPAWAEMAIAQANASCIASPPCDAWGVQASVLMLTASAENQPAQGGLFTECLMKTWAQGGFSGTYCDLYKEVKRKVQHENQRQEPQILMVGKPDPAFPLGPAFRPPTRKAAPHEPVSAGLEAGLPVSDPYAADRDEPEPDGDRRDQTVVYRGGYR